MKCNICNSDNLIPFFQIGVDNLVVMQGPEYSEISMQLAVCRSCGNLQAYPESIKIKSNKSTWRVTE